MAKYCSKSCHAICDFCRFYKDKYRDIEKKIDDNGRSMFAGIGVCEITKEEVTADNFCDGFYCFRAE